ncbi:hypothetical protein [Kribbella sp. HUAS MG21]|uniref:Uncharacterized protein n=1 Tax=Kribbella sp. HUAS MG21 TaxID=3160966 RepID=A0AAU7TBQ6_9ACTN
MAGWASLRVELRRLEEEAPGALVVWPGPESERREDKPASVQLAAWATGIAGELHATYGDFVQLQVGAMSFPDKQLLVRDLRGERGEVVGLHVAAAGPLSVRSGRSSHSDVLVTNRTAHQQVLVSSRRLSSAVTDASGKVVGLYVGPINAVRVEFPIEPHATRSVPVLIGTASVVPSLGYAVPPGTWGLAIELRTANAWTRSAPLELTVTP